MTSIKDWIPKPKPEPKPETEREPRAKNPAPPQCPPWEFRPGGGGRYSIEEWAEICFGGVGGTDG